MSKPTPAEMDARAIREGSVGRRRLVAVRRGRDLGGFYLEGGQVFARIEAPRGELPDVILRG